MYDDRRNQMINVETHFTMYGRPFDVRCNGILPNGHLDQPFDHQQYVQSGTHYIVLPYHTLGSIEFIPEAVHRMLPYMTNIISPWHEDLSVQPYNARNKEWDIIGLTQLIDIFNARVLEFQKSPNPRRTQNGG